MELAVALAFGPWVALPMLLATLLAQVPPPTEGWLTGIITGIGPAALSTGILWKIHQDAVKRHATEIDAAMARMDALTDRMFALAQAGSKVAQLGAEVLRDDPKDPGLGARMDRIERLLLEIGHDQRSE